MSTVQEIREKGNEDLVARKSELRREIFLLKSKHAPESKDATFAAVRKYKKEIARIETILTEREIDAFYRELLNLELSPE